MSDHHRPEKPSERKSKRAHKSKSSKNSEKENNSRSKTKSNSDSKHAAKKYSQEESTIILEEIRSRPSRKGDNYCADCQARDPRWAVSNIGIFVCIRCSGVHRSIGTHISKVRSTNMDRWTEEQLDCMRNSGGNDGVNALYEAKLDPGFTRPQTDYDAEIFIREKYVQKKYFSALSIDTTILKDSQANATSRTTIELDTNGIYSIAQLQKRAQLLSPMATEIPQDGNFKTFDASLWR